MERLNCQLHIPDSLQPDIPVLVELLQQLSIEALKGDLPSFSGLLNLSNQWLSLAGHVFVLRLGIGQEFSRV